jgi:hypothetical protein
MVFFASIGLLDYISQWSFTLFILDLHVIHSWIGLSALLLSVFNFASRVFLGGKRFHCVTGYAGVAMSILALSLGVTLLLGSGTPSSNLQTDQVPAVKGTQYIDRESYRLHVTGLVENELNVTYMQLLSLPAYSQVVYLPCVEGWGFNAKWTGFRIADLFELARLRSNATYVVFHSSDGYSTGLPLDYLINRNVLMAYGINDVTLPADRGFPLQVVAIDKYGYKWAKWVTEVEVVDKVVAGFWESRGYSNNADVGTFPYGG